MEKKQIKLLSMREATPEEIENIVQSKWDSERMQNYCKKTEDFYILNDGLVLELEKVNKISIDSHFWFDDEKPIPENSEALFLNENIKFHLPERNYNNYWEQWESLQSGKGATGLYDYNGIQLRLNYSNNNIIVYACYQAMRECDRAYFKRYMTSLEVHDFNEIVKARQEAYIERLKKYYKRYGSKVRCSGYWVNR